ncbi:MAG: GNAT family N-acetyltransferase [Clostridiales bacterium]|nr:GNAT family N-acetyltransferase [Clostridiales bacterium]
MELREANSRELRRIKRIYLEAFPGKERKPFGMMKRKVRQGKMEILSLMDGKRLVGLAITVLYKDMVLLDYFAVAKDARGRNHGSGALALLKERYADRRFMLEIELLDDAAANREERIRRKRFYLKNGMQETGIEAMVFRVPMEVLNDGKPLTYEEYHAVYEKVIGPVFARMVYPLNTFSFSE